MSDIVERLRRPPVNSDTDDVYRLHRIIEDLVDERDEAADEIERLQSGRFDHIEKQVDAIRMELAALHDEVSTMHERIKNLRI